MKRLSEGAEIHLYFPLSLFDERQEQQSLVSQNRHTAIHSCYHSQD